MKVYLQAALYAAIVTMAIFITSCEEDYETNADDPSILLSSGGGSIKAPGNGQYRLPALSGEEVTVTADLSSVSNLQSFSITKTVNLDLDEKFGDNGVLTVNPGDVDGQYTFTYKPDTTEIDQLLAFTFRAEDGSGNVKLSDLTMAVTLSPRDNLPRRKWLWTSKLWVDANNAQDLRECQKDDYFLFNKDSTMSLNFGEVTGSGDCAFDGLNVYDDWYLSEDGKSFVMRFHSIFSPANIVTENYRVITLTTEKLELEIDYDLTVFGLGPEETFLFTFTALPR